MFLKQYNYKPRSNSQSSGSDQVAQQQQQQQPQQEAAQQASSPTDTAASAFGAAAAGRRRSSVTDRFQGLQSHKRGSSDAANEAKRSGFLDQKPGSQGILGGMWQSFTKGS